MSILQRSMTTLLLVSQIAVPLWVASPPCEGAALFWNSSTSAPVSLALEQASAINNAGIVVGDVGLPNPQAPPYIQAAEVSIFSPRIPILLNGVPLGLGSAADDINNLGQVIVNYENLSGYNSAFLWSPATGIQSLGTLGGSFSTASAINDAGQIVGQSGTATNGLRAFLWSSNTGMTAVGDASTYLATDVNNSGQMACLEDPFPYTHIHSALCGPGATAISSLVLGIPNMASSDATAINNLGWIVGTFNVPYQQTEGFLWTPHGVTIFGTSFIPVDLNNLGEVIGSYSGQPAVWTVANGYQVLPNSFGASLNGINDNGQIVGNIQMLPEPNSVSLSLSSLSILALSLLRHQSKAAGA